MSAPQIAGAILLNAYPGPLSDVIHIFYCTIPVRLQPLPQIDKIPIAIPKKAQAFFLKNSLSFFMPDVFTFINSLTPRL